MEQKNGFQPWLCIKIICGIFLKNKQIKIDVEENTQEILHVVFFCFCFNFVSYLSQTDDMPGSKVSNAPLHVCLSSKGDYDDELKLRITNLGARMTTASSMGQ